MEDALYDSLALRSFVAIDLGQEPDETTVCKFRHLLERRGLPALLFAEVKPLPGGARAEAGHGHHRRRGYPAGAELDQKQGWSEGPRHAAGEEGRASGTSA